MSIFGNIINKIFHHGQAKAAAPGQANTAAPTAAPQQQAGTATATAPAPAPAQQVDVGSVLSEMASMKGGGGNYQSSIVDLLKLLDLDSSLDARKELAEELNDHTGENGTAEQNIALHRAVMQKLAENGGIVPAELRD